MKDEPHTSATGPWRCWHCGEPVTERGRWPVTVDGLTHETCCAGCQAVARAIAGSGLADYYRVREATAAPHRAEADTDPLLYDQPDIQARFVRESEGRCEATLLVEGLRCGACVWLLEQSLGKEPGVNDARVNLAAERAQLSWDPAQTTLSRVLAAARRVGYELVPFGAPQREARLAAQSKARLRRLFIAGIAMMQVMMYAFPAYLAGPGEIEPEFDSLMRWASLVLTLPVMFYSATPFLVGAWRDLRTLRPGMDTPVAIGLIAAFAASVAATLTGEGEVWFDTVTMFVFLLLAARHLEWLARKRATQALDRLTAARPQTVERFEGDSDRLERVPASRLSPGDRFIVGQGETLAVDSVMLEGPAQFDQSLLTGESMPVKRQEGDTVPGGAINLGNPIRMRATQSWAASTLSTLARLAEQAGLARPRITAVTDHVARWFVTGLLFFALSVALIWLQVDASQALPIAIAVLVVSCPCALSLATPAALAAASGHALARGLVLSRGDALESIASVTDVVFDKTGTLTEGQPGLIAVEAVETDGTVDSQMSSPVPGTPDRWLAIAAALELGHGHPLAQSIREAARSRNFEVPQAEALANHPGEGVSGVVEGIAFRLGRRGFVEPGKTGPSTDDVAEDEIVIWLGVDGRALARFRFTDRLRGESLMVVEGLRERGLKVHLLSGDRAARVGRVARTLAIESVQSEASPDDKLAFVRALQHEGRSVLMVGDGINDAPVLAGADVSVAVGQASALAKISADVVMLGGHLGQLNDLHTLAQDTRKIIRQNLGWAMLYNLLAIPLAAFGLVSAWVAALGMSLSSLLVAGNALRLLPRARRTRPTTSGQVGHAGRTGAQAAEVTR